MAYTINPKLPRLRMGQLRRLEKSFFYLKLIKKNEAVTHSFLAEEEALIRYYFILKLHLFISSNSLIVDWTDKLLVLASKTLSP